MRTLFLGLFVVAGSAFASRFPFSIGQTAEVVAELRMALAGFGLGRAGA